MNQPSKQTFGLLIAYIIPGVVVLWGLSFCSEQAAWLLARGQQPTVGGFLYITVASVGLGMTASAVRWMFVDAIHHRTGLKPPEFDFAELRLAASAYSMLIEFHYRYYQFYANMLVAIVAVYPMYRLTPPLVLRLTVQDMAVLIVLMVFWHASRDTLGKYYNRVDAILSSDRAIFLPFSHPGASCLLLWVSLRVYEWHRLS